MESPNIFRVSSERFHTFIILLSSLGFAWLSSKGWDMSSSSSTPTLEGLIDRLLVNLFSGGANGSQKNSFAKW